MGEHLNGMVEEFAWAVAEPGKPVLLIGPDNEGRGWTDPSKAIASGEPFAVRVRDSIMAGDFDQADGTDRALKAAKKLADVGFEPVVLKSGQPGRAHLWVRAQGVRRKEVRAVLVEEGADVREGTKLIRPPFSPHRLGCVPELVWPRSQFEVLGLLRRRLPGKWSTVLKQGWPKGSRSEGLLSLALAYLHAGRSKSEFVKDVVSNPAGAGDKTANRSDGVQYLEKTFEQALRRWNKTGSHGANDGFLDSVEAAADRFKWPARLSQAHITLMALVDIGRASGRRIVFASVRDVSERSGHAVPTVSRHLVLLRKLGWLVLVSRACDGYAACYEIKLAAGHESGTPLNTSPPSADKRVFREDRFAEALSGRPLQRRILAFIPPEGITVVDLAARANVSVESCRNAVKGLLSFGLITRQGRLIVAVRSGDAAKDAARLRGRLGAMDRRRETYKNERIAWRQHRNSGFKHMADEPSTD